MKTRTLLVDSDYLLKRSFNGAKDTFTKSFGDIGGLYSFLTTVRKLIKEHHINKVVLCWDGENGGIHRYYIDSDYKSNRKDKKWNKKIELSDFEIKKEEEKKHSILKQRKRIQAYAEELFLRQIEVEDIEGDDLIASYCLEYNNKEEITLFTNDRDFLQLLDLNITIHFANIERPINNSNFFFHFNYHYRNAIIMKIICGDTADNIKGIKGMGEDTLLEHFPDLKFREYTVREICIGASEINKDRISRKMKPLKVFLNLLENIERLKTNFLLVNLRIPLLNEQAIEDLAQLALPLSPNDRGAKNLVKMMSEDEFLIIYKSTFVNYVEPFYTVIQNEKDMYNEYLRNNKNNI
jgi:5'-3' exonuclease